MNLSGLETKVIDELINSGKLQDAVDSNINILIKIGDKYMPLETNKNKTVIFDLNTLSRDILEKITQIQDYNKISGDSVLGLIQEHINNAFKGV